MDILKDAWLQGGAVGLLFAGCCVIIWRLYQDGKAKDKRNDEFGERVLTVAVQSVEAIRADTDAKVGLIERFDRWRP